MKRRGQVSVEYILVLGLAFLILVPGGYLFYNFSKTTEDGLVGSQINRIGLELMNRVQEMYSVGQNSWSTVVIDLPEVVNNIYVVNGSELVIAYDTQSGESNAIFFSDINITTPYPGGNVSPDFKPGYTKIKVSSQSNNVEIMEIT